MFVRPVFALAALALLLLPVGARAQLVNQTSADPAWTVSVTRPTLAADGEIVNCAFPQAGCQQFNRAACDIAGKPLQLSVGRGSTTQTLPTFVPSKYFAYAWLQTNQGVCSNSPVVNPNGIYSIPGGVAGNSGVTPALEQSSIFFAGGGSTGLVIPDDMNGSITTRDILQAVPGACDPNVGIQFTYWRICFGVPVNSSNFVNSGTVQATQPGVAITGDLSGFWQFPVDTLPPDPPTSIHTKSLVGQVQLTVNFDNSAQDSYRVDVMYSSDPNLVNGVPCSQWSAQGSIDGQKSTNVSPSDSSTALAINGTNGVEYAYCARVIDLVGNVGDYADPVYDSPHPECSFFDCYPGDLRAGFCAGGLPPAWYVVALAGLAWRLGRRRHP